MKHILSRFHLCSISTFICLAFALTSSVVHAQVGIGIESPDPTAQLHVHSTKKGFLAPKMTQSEREEIENPSQGLLVYQTDGQSGLYY